MLFTPERLKYLVEVADQGSFSAAARKLGVSAAAVSQSIQNLEIELDLPLFDRTAGQRPTLTQAGKGIYLQALELLPRLDAIEAKAYALKEGVEAQLTIALHWLAAYPAISDKITQLIAAYPQLQIRLVDADDLSMKLGRDADVVIGPATMDIPRGVESCLITREEWIFVCAKHHPLAQRKAALSSADLLAHHQVVMPIPAVLGEEGVEMLRYSINVIECERFFQFAELILQGAGFAFFPANLAKHYLEQGLLVELSVDFALVDISWPLELRWTQALGAAGMSLVEDLQTLS